MNVISKKTDLCWEISAITSPCTLVVAQILLVIHYNNSTELIFRAILVLLIQFMAIILGCYASITSSNSKQYIASIISTIFANIIFVVLLVWELIWIHMSVHIPMVG